MGELVMLRYHKQFNDDYCLAKVTEVHPDEDSLVRKVTVSYRKKNPRESPQIYKSKPLISEQVAIHRIHRLDLEDEAVQVPGEVDEAAGDGSVDGVHGQAVAGGGGVLGHDAGLVCGGGSVLGHDVGQVSEGGDGVLVHDAGQADDASDGVKFNEESRCELILKTDELFCIYWEFTFAKLFLFVLCILCLSILDLYYIKKIQCHIFTSIPLQG